MDEKRRVLIVECGQNWQTILEDVFPSEQFEVQTVPTRDQAIGALQAGDFDLIVVDPDDQPQTEPLRVVADIAGRYPGIPLLIVSEQLTFDQLQNTAQISTESPLIVKASWDTPGFLDTVEHLLATWGPPEPEITPPSEEEDRATELTFDRLSGATRMFSATGLTGPLTTGLIPPPIGTRQGKPRVLIVEDQAQWQHAFAALMEQEDYFWRVAPNYEQAMERLRLESFHVVVLDLMIGESGDVLHEGKGWQLLDYLVVNCVKTKVIVASGDASRADVAKLFMRYPIKGFVDKDFFDEGEMLSMIREQIAGPTLKIQMLGNFRVWRDGKSVTDFGDNEAERTIKILLTRRGENVSVDELVGFLWPGVEPKEAYANLSAAINSARAILEPDLPRPNDSNFILRNGANYTFNFLANLDIDAEQFRLRVSEARFHERQGDVAEALKDYEAVRAMYQGDYLPGDRSAPWASQERSMLQGLYTATLNRIADIYAGMDKLDQAIEAASRSLQVDAYSESTYRRLMRYYSCKGDQKMAKNMYRNLVTLFSEFFGEAPSSVTTRLYEDIVAGHDVVCVEPASSSGEWRLAGEN